MPLDARRMYLVPPCDAEADGELTVLGVRQSTAVGDHFGDIPLRAVYADTGMAALDTAAAIGGRHGLVVRRKPALGTHGQELFDVAAARIIATFESIARAGSGRTSLIVTAPEALRIIHAHCSGLAPSPEDRLVLEPASITEITIEESQYVVERLGDTTHLERLEPRH